MSLPTELIYTGKCKELFESFEKTNKVYINQKNITIKEGTKEFNSFYDEWKYYPVTFICTDNINPPKDSYFAGDFIYSEGYIKKY
jgi:hypothetical protein